MQFLAFYCALWTALITACGARVVLSHGTSNHDTTSLARRANDNDNDHTDVEWDLARVASGNVLQGVALKVSLPSRQNHRLGLTSKAQKSILTLDIQLPKSWVLGEGMPENKRVPDKVYWRAPTALDNSEACNPVQFAAGVLGEFSTKLMKDATLGFGTNRPQLKWPLHSAFDVVERATDLREDDQKENRIKEGINNLYRRMIGDGNFGLSPSAAEDFVSRFYQVPAKFRTITAQMLVLSLRANSLILAHVGENTDRTVDWFELEQNEGQDRWSIASDLPPSDNPIRLQLTTGRVVFTTAHPQSNFAGSVVEDYFAQWPSQLYKRDDGSLTWYIDCDADLSTMPDFKPDIQGGKLRFGQAAKRLRGPPQSASQGGQERNWCRSHLQEAQDFYVESEGIWGVIGLAFMEDFDVILDPKGRRLGVSKLQEVAS